MIKAQFTPDYDQGKFDEVVMRAWVDMSFRRRLLSSPKEALREAGVELPEHVNVTVHEFDPSDRHVFLPPFNMETKGSSKPERKAIKRPPGAPNIDPVPEGRVSYGVANPFLPVETRQIVQDEKK